MYYLLIFWAINTSGAGGALSVEKIEFSDQTSCLSAAKTVNDARSYAMTNAVIVCVKK